MAFQPVIPAGGLVGWRFLQQTRPAQEAAFRDAPAIQRDTAYFAERIGQIDSAAELVSDRRLLSVALGAFGLQDDINNRYFVQRMLDDGTIKPDALANRMADDRYKSFSRAFGFGDFAVPRTKLSDFADEIVNRYLSKSFEVAVGDQQEDMRLALNAQSELPRIASESGTNDTKWFRVMGNAPLRKLFEVALGLPESFGQIDLDKQLEIFRDKAARQFGTGEIDEIATPEMLDRVVQRFLVRTQVDTGPANIAGSIALTLLQSAPMGRG
ncbi:DUF1217 domain-containing protein [Aquicoccus porphyridii]|uniref:DUF1217 domain-containing protein n=1 Tax=Aquicoccus porphyridii TaxID=1852029 RepID=UPI00273CFD11|nr:DUF1217 domain-containing protein [Aquicoccus porphyridii]